MDDTSRYQVVPKLVPMPAERLHTMLVLFLMRMPVLTAIGHSTFAGLPQVGYKLVPFTIGAAQPTLLTGPDCAVTARGEFATKHLWVTAHDDAERWPAGEFTVQSAGGDGLPAWVAADRPLVDADIVLWHCFGVVHVPRPEDFPVMPCEMTGFALKPDGFFTGNPAVDLPPESNAASKQCCSSSD